MKRFLLGVSLSLFSIFMIGHTVMADTVTGVPGFGISQNNGFTGDAYKNKSDERVPVYFFYSAFKRDYFWTASEDEMNQLLVSFNTGEDTYQYQGISGHAELKSTEQNVPVYRFWNSKSMDHFYTISEEEKKQLMDDYKSGKDNYEYEGIAWYVPQISTVPVYRFFDVINYDHFYTSDEQAKDRMSQAFMNGTGSYRYEGIAWYWYI